MDRSRAIFSCALRRIKKESHLNQSEKDIPEKDGKITTASAAALMPALTCPRPLPRATISALCGTLNPTISRVTNEKCRHIPRRSPIYQATGVLSNNPHLISSCVRGRYESVSGTYLHVAKNSAALKSFVRSIKCVANP